MKKILYLVLVLVLLPSLASAIELTRQKNAITLIAFPLTDSIGNLVTSATGRDSEYALWNDTDTDSTDVVFSDCFNEAEEIAATGLYVLALTAAETNDEYVIVHIKHTTANGRKQTMLIRTEQADPAIGASTEAGRALDVTAAGLAGIDLDNTVGKIDGHEIDIDTNTVGVVLVADATTISGSGAAADNLEEMLNNDDVEAPGIEIARLQIESTTEEAVYIKTTNATSNGIYVEGATTGGGVKIKGGASGVGLWAEGGASGGAGAYFLSGGGAANGLQILSTGGNGLDIDATVGAGVQITGGTAEIESDITGTVGSVVDPDNIADAVLDERAADHYELGTFGNQATFSYRDVQQVTNYVNFDTGTVLIECETFATNWTLADGDSANNNTDFDFDGDADDKLTIEGINSIAVFASDLDSTKITSPIDTSAIDARYFDNFSFWCYVDGDHNHEGVNPDDVHATFMDGTTPLEFIRFSIATESGITNGFSYQWGDTTVARGWNRFLIHKDEMTAFGSGAWPDDDADDPFAFVEFAVGCDSTGSFVRAIFDGVRFDQRSRAKFMFRLDDGAKTQLTHAYPVFQDHGFKASTYVNPNTIEVAAATSLIVSDLDSLYNQGWDICNHGWNGLTQASPDSMPLAGGWALYEDWWRANNRDFINGAQQYLLDRGWNRGAAYFSWPYDAYDSVALEVVRERHDFATGGKLGQTNGHYGLDLPDSADAMRYTVPYEPYIASAYLGNPDYEPSIETFRGWIDAAIQRGNALIVGMHAFGGHFVDTALIAVKATDDGWEFNGDSELRDLQDTTGTGVVVVPDTTTYVFLEDAAAATTLLFTTNMWDSLWHAKDRDGARVDTLHFDIMVRATGGSVGDYIRFVADTTIPGDFVFDSALLAAEWTTASSFISGLSETWASGFEIGFENAATVAATDADSILVALLRVRVGDDQGEENVTDSSYLAAVCNYLEEKRGQIDVVTMSEYFGVGNMFNQVLADSRETRDSMVSFAENAPTAPETADAVWDELKAQHVVAGSFGELTGKIDHIMAYWGACDSCYMRLYPEDGSSNKDSVIVIDPTLGADSLIAKIRYFHSGVPSVYDSTVFYYDDPWGTPYLPEP